MHNLYIFFNFVFYFTFFKHGSMSLEFFIIQDQLYSGSGGHGVCSTLGMVIK